MTASLRYRLSQTGPSIRVAMEGSLTFAGHRPLRRLLDDLAPIAESRPVIFDLSQIAEVDSAGLGLLLIARQILGEGLSLAAPSAPAERVLSLTGFHAQIPCSG
jgi:anti-anti-sigma factor